MHAALTDLFGFEPGSQRLVVSNDCELLTGPIEFHCLALHPTSKQCEAGVVLIAGTGSIATAYRPAHDNDPCNRHLTLVGRLGGYGYLLGDEGSAYFVGRQAVKTVLQASDRGELEAGTSTHPSSIIARSILLRAILEHFQVQTATDLLGAVYRLDKLAGQTEHDRKIRLAEVSRIVMRCAYPSDSDQLGDQFAIQIMEETAGELSKLLAELCTLHQLQPQRTVLCLGGGMWAYEAFKELVLKITQERWGAQWAWVERVEDPDQMGAISLVRRHRSLAV